MTDRPDPSSVRSPRVLDVLLPPLGVFALLFGAVCLRDLPEVGVVAFALVIVGALTARLLREPEPESEPEEHAVAQREDAAQRR